MPGSSTFHLSPVGDFEQVYPADANELQVQLAELGPGVHQTAAAFVRIGNDGNVEWVASRLCDHANGKLFLNADGSTAGCPLHGWQLDLGSLAYTNCDVKKKRLEFRVDNDTLLIDARKPELRVPDAARFGPVDGATVRFLAHASLAIDIGGLRIVTDPWLLGPCFTSGWWHSIPPKDDALEILASADVVYISHNHPDHMHRETLKWLVERRPDIPIIGPAFESESVLRPVQGLGFTNVSMLPFNSLYRADGTPVVLSIFKCGDFRDDSGLFATTDNFSALLTVDSSMLNNMVLPADIDLLATSFAGGASGYPWCFEHHPFEERRTIGLRHRGALRKMVSDYVSATRPKHYMPYAGYFTEAAERDAFVKENNSKNTLKQIRQLVTAAAPDAVFLDPGETDIVRFDAEGRPTTDVEQRERLFQVDAPYIQAYLDTETQAADGFDLATLETYFADCGFNDDLMVYLQPTDDDFAPAGDGLAINFGGDGQPSVTSMSAGDLAAAYTAASEGSTRHLQLRVRKGPLWEVVTERLPWEDLSIGFQCRVHRTPDVYNSAFWFHFTNTYIGD